MRELLRLGRLLAPHRARIALGLALALAAVLANIGLLALSSWFIASMALAGSLGLVMEYGLPAAAIRALAIVRAGGRYAERLVNHDTTFRILASLRLWFYRSVGPLAPARLEAYRSGDLLARIRADIDSLDDYYLRGLVPAAVALLTAACILPLLSRFDPRLALIDGLALAAAGLLVPCILALLAAAPGRARVKASAELRASIVEELEGMSELVALGAAGPHAALMEELASNLDGSQRKLCALAGAGEASLTAASSLAVWGSSAILVGLLASGSLPPADMAFLSVFVLASFESILPLPAAIQKAGEMAAAARRLFEILDAEPAVGGPSGQACDSARDGRDSARVGHDSARVGHGSARVGHGSAGVGHDSARVGRDSARDGPGSARVGRDSARVGHGSAAEQRPSGVLSRPTAALLRPSSAEPRPSSVLPRPSAAEPRPSSAEASPSIAETRLWAPRGGASPSEQSPAAPALGLSIRGLSFRYAPDLPPVFEELDLELPAGTRLGLAGPSGAGKSSLVSLLLRFWDYQGGTIELLPRDGGPGRDLRSLSGDEARAFFSALPQAPFLYHASIRENLLLAALPEGGSEGPGVEERLLDACEAAQLSGLLARLPLGLDTIVGETGRAVSAGELQRIALARAFLKDAPIYLLDEPTEGLDDATAEALLEATAIRLEGRSLLIISHRERDFCITDGVKRLDRA